MPAVRSKPPAALQQVFVDSTALLEPLMDPDALRQLRERSNTTFFVGPLYGLDAAEILAGIDLRRARLIGWSYLVPDPAGLPAGVEIGADTNGGIWPHSAQFVQGTFVRSLAQVLPQVEAMTETRSSTINLLRIPSLKLFSLWLSTEHSGNDLYFPLRPSPHGIAAGEAYSENKLAELLRIIAHRLAEQGLEGEG